MRGVKGSPGTLSLKFFKVSDSEPTGWQVTEMSLPYSSAVYSFKIHGATIDLKAGAVMVSTCLSAYLPT